MHGRTTQREEPAARPEAPPLVFDRAGVREVDRLCVEEFGLPGIVLMENAARALAQHALRMLESAAAAGGGRRGALLVCGPGANGGDGFAAARHMHNAGAPVLVACTHDPATVRGDAGINLGALTRMGVTVEPLAGADAAGALREIVARAGAPALIVDCMLGTGLDRALEEPFASIALWINSRRPAGSMVLACDVPSGLDCDTGAPAGGPLAPCVRADATVTFCGLKKGFRARTARAYTGAPVVADIGAPRELLTRLALRG